MRSGGGFGSLSAPTNAKRMRFTWKKLVDKYYKRRCNIDK